MHTSNSNEAGPRPTSAQVPRWWWPVAVCALFVVLVALLLPRPKGAPPDSAKATNAAGFANRRGVESTRPNSGVRRFGPDRDAVARTPEQIVAEKVVQFGRKRRELVHAIAGRKNLEVPPEVEAFFDAIEAGNWDEIHRLWQYMATHTWQYDYSKNDRPDFEPFWGSVLDAYGVAEQAHEWPAQKLLDYGNAILDSLRPGMVYVGGTDDGRWVPELMNETGGDPHIIVTQNALADSSYLDYLRELYGERFNTLSKEDSERAFKEYTADAQKRLQHDLDFPDEPKQVRAGEDIKSMDGRVQVSGMVAVMAINEKLLQTLMQKNPELPFAMQESQPLRGMYADSLPLGPLMELGAKDAQTGFTAERAAQSVDYWRAISQNLLGDPEATGSTYALRAYSHNVNSTANLLAAHSYDAEAEQAYRLSSQIWPGNPDAAGGLATILARTGRADQARQLLDEFARKYPDQLAALKKFAGSITFEISAPKSPP